MELKKSIAKQKSFLLEEINLNVNEILSFTFNIDNLKLFLTTLYKNQNLLSKKILQLEKKLKLKDSFIPDSKSIRAKLANSVRGIHFNLNSLKKDNELKESKKYDKKNIENKFNDNERVGEKNDLEKLNEEKKFKNDILKELENGIVEENKEEETKNNNENDNENNININKDVKEKNENDNKDDNEDLYTIENNENEEEEGLYSDKDNEEDIKEENTEKNTNKENKDINEAKETKLNNENIDNNNNKNIKTRNNELVGENDSEFVTSNYEIFEINNKIKNIQKKIKNLELLNKVNKFTSNIDDKSEDIQMIKLSLKDLKSDNGILKQENEELKKKIENINVKLTEINIFDLFKDCQLEDGSIDAARALVISLEKKFLKKTALMDERDKKLVSDFLDLKNKLQNVVNKNGVIEHHINDVRNNFKLLGELVSKTNNDNTNTVNNMEKKMNNMYKELFDKYDEKNSKIESNILKINDKILNLEKFKNENQNISNVNDTNNLELNEETLKYLSIQNNRINDIENKINSIIELSEKNPTKEDIEKLEKEISKKSNSQDYYDLKEKYNIQLAKANNLEEYLERLQDMTEKKNSEMVFYTKKIENLTANVVTMRAQLETIASKEENKLLDLTRYLEKVTFNKYLVSVQNEKKKVENNFEEIRKIINEISNTIKTKCNAEDLKAYENIFNNKIEELKLINSRKYADKLDTNKSMKYLDTQIRHIIDVYIKRLDKNDSWLIAKKPLGGFSCASCESYLGELKNREMYLPWNKYPQRDKEQNQNYRVGNGFSRMLNMLNVELKNNEINSIEKELESDDDLRQNSEDNNFKLRIKNSPKSQRDIFKDRVNRSMNKINSSNITNKSNILPKININKNEENSSIEINNNEVGVETSLIGQNGEDNIHKENKDIITPQPHIVKIIKKNKLSSMDSSRTERPGTNHIK